MISRLHRFETVFIVRFIVRGSTETEKEAVVARSESDARKKFRTIGRSERLAQIVSVEDTDESPYVYFNEEA